LFLLRYVIFAHLNSNNSSIFSAFIAKWRIQLEAEIQLSRSVKQPAYAASAFKSTERRKSSSRVRGCTLTPLAENGSVKTGVPRDRETVRFLRAVSHTQPVRPNQLLRIERERLRTYSKLYEKLEQPDQELYEFILSIANRLNDVKTSLITFQSLFRAGAFTARRSTRAVERAGATVTRTLPPNASVIQSEPLVVFAGPYRDRLGTASSSGSVSRTSSATGGANSPILIDESDPEKNAIAVSFAKTTISRSRTNGTTPLPAGCEKMDTDHSDSDSASVSSTVLTTSSSAGPSTSVTQALTPLKRSASSKYGRVITGVSSSGASASAPKMPRSRTPSPKATITVSERASAQVGQTVVDPALKQTTLTYVRFQPSASAELSTNHPTVSEALPGSAQTVEPTAIETQTASSSSGEATVAPRDSINAQSATPIGQAAQPSAESSSIAHTMTKSPNDAIVKPVRLLDAKESPEPNVVATADSPSKLPGQPNVALPLAVTSSSVTLSQATSVILSALQALGDRFGISRERARQLEKRMLTRLRAYLEKELGSAVDIGPRDE
jgi:hypothetical protein